MVIQTPTSVLIESQFPQFFSEDGPNLVEFIKAYYQWMEQVGYATEVSKGILDKADIDKTLDLYVNYFKQEIMADIPDTVLTDRRALAKNIMDFYLTRGTSKSYKLLFRILYDDDVEILLSIDRHSKSVGW